MQALWAAGLLLRRIRTERGIIVLVFSLVAATSFLFAAAPRLFNRVADDALVHAARVAPPAQRNVALVLDATLPPDPDGGVSAVRAFGERIAEDFPASVAALIAERSVRVTTLRLYLPDPPIYETHLSLRYQDGLTDATRLVSGHWPVDHGVPLRVADGTDSEPVVVEAALSTAEATEIGVQVGDRVAVVLDGSDPLVRETPFQLAPTEIEVVGLYEPLDPDAEYWYGSNDLLQVSQEGSDDSPIAYATGYVAAEMYRSLWASGLTFHYEWRFLVDPGRIDAGQVAQLQVDLRRLRLLSGPLGEELGTVVVVTGLPGILEEFAAERALAESVLSMAAIGPFGLAGGAMAMVAILLVRGRRATLALARGRGASGSLVLGTQLWEATVLAGSAALVGLLIAVTVIPARVSDLSSLLAVAVAGVATLILVGASWSMARRPLGQLERDDAPVLRVAPRRLVIELTIVVVAVAATLLLRQRGLTVGPAGSVARIDPLLASVPVLSGLAAGIVALRLYPLPIRALGWLAGRGRALVPVLGLRTIARHPAAANLPLLVLLLTAAFGAFSSVIVSSLDRGQVVASYLDVGADYRVEKIGAGALAPALDPGGIPGVEAVAPGIVDSSVPFTSSAFQRASIYINVVDPLAYATVAAGTPVDPAWPNAFLDAPGGTGLGTDENPIPAILSFALPVGSTDLVPGDIFHVTFLGQRLALELVEERARFPGIDARIPFAVVPFNWVRAAFGDQPPPPSIMWLRAPGDVAAALAAKNAEVRAGSRIVSRYDAYAATHDAPLGAVIATGYGLAVAVAAMYMAITIIGALILSAARRTRDLAFLRTLGMSARQALTLTIVEHAPPVLLALIPGVALGIGVAILCQPGLGLATFVGAASVPLFVDWSALVLMTGGLIGVVALAVTAGTWLSRRGQLVDALRIGDD